METSLISDDVKIDLSWCFKVGDKTNKLPLHRDFLMVDMLGTIIVIENVWDLLYTYTVKDIEHTNGKYYDYVFKKIGEISITMFNGNRCIVVNRNIDLYTICIIWNVDNNDVDFICKFVDENNIPVLMTSNNVIEHYGIEILVT